ncbi:YlaH-like family protein [Abyssicoccus albus]|uniref:YlaH-like protein n=1 Tax=Abyssicoccus albus TaxID=1817405 RepID=A0A1Q1G0S1_9BACL|nr:YlaH-like family protein [Abyssicoccus albus]AQL55954.1 hypothetical protein BVH56_02965 [Abyssicoccus albus]RPF58237.1 YlaH-like protein [Abyssicoccus albus]
MLYVTKGVSLDAIERLSFFAKLYQVDKQPDTGMWLLFITIFILCVITYNLGFARKIKWWQNIIIYVIMFFGCTLLTFLGAFLPVAESLIVTAIILGLYRYRLHKERKAGNV